MTIVIPFKRTCTVKAILILLALCLSVAGYAQVIRVQPYLQDAEPSSIKVMWESEDETSHRVDWGMSSGSLSNTIMASSLTSSGSNLIHEVLISGLTPSTRYFYQALSGPDSSSVFDFITPPNKDSNQSFNLVAMSDMQKNGGEPNVFDEVVHEGVIDYLADNYGNDIPTDLGFVLIPGDLVPNGNSYNQWKNDFFDEANPLFSHVPVYPVLGNHENNSTYYFDYFELPHNGSAGYDEHWWYKDYSNVRIIGLNSNSGYRIQEQLDWLQSTLDEACSDDDIDFVFAQLHHPHLSELWTPGELNYTGDVIDKMEQFSTDCGKPSIHFFGHTHGYSRGQSRDHEHLWVNVASAGGAIDNWGEFPNADYEEFNTSIDEYGFVILNVEAGATPQFTLKRISRGDGIVNKDNEEQDAITLRKTNIRPQTPITVFPSNQEVIPDCIILEANQFSNSGTFHQASHWQVSTTCGDFSNPVIDSWKQHENWYNEINTQADDLLYDEQIEGLNSNSSYCWRVRYRDEHLKWSEWSSATSFTTSNSGLSQNLLLNGDAENGVSDWTIETGIIESLGAEECNGINPYNGEKYFAVGGLCDGNETDYSEVYQIIDISAEASAIDAGTENIKFGGYFSNFSGGDEPAMFIEYLDENQDAITASAKLTSTSSTWVNLTSTESVPVESRFLKVVLSGTRNSGSDNDSYFDDLIVRFTNDECASSSLLPVELIDFDVICHQDQPHLAWNVASEINVKEYIIEGSNDGNVWNTLGTISASNSDPSSANRYTHSVPSSALKAQYFRLKIMDLDQSTQYSAIVGIQCEHIRSISLFPNPVSKAAFRIKYEQNKKDDLNITIYNAMGQLYYTHTWSVHRGYQELNIATDLWESGIYYVQVASPNWQWEDRLILK